MNSNIIWELGRFWPNDGRNTSLASYYALMREVHVLLVDHDSDSLISTAKMLDLCSYKVTYVELASTALSMLLSGKSHFDLVMTNINSPDMYGYKLLQQAVSMDIPIILMSIDDNAILAKGALENGAFLFIKKPVTLDMLKCLWQHVAREKMRIHKEKERLVGMTAANINNMKGIEIREEVEEENNIVGCSNKYKGKKKKIQGQKGLIVDEESEQERQTINNKFKRKACTEWTGELHEKFMDAVRQLGEGRCFPKEIVELMNVPGLTRMQVASHLQKCRDNNWRVPVERKSHQNSVPAPASSDAESSGQNKTRRYGSMPRLNKNSLLFQEHLKASEDSNKIHSEKEIPNDGGHENISVAEIMNSHQQYHEQFLSGPSNARAGSNPSSKPRHPSHGIFNFPDMDGLMHSYSGMEQGSDMNMSQRNGPDSDQVYPDQQNSAIPNEDTRSHWGSETSNFANDSSKTGDEED